MKNLNIHIGASLWFILTSTIFVWVILNFDKTIEPDWPWERVDSESVHIPDLRVNLRNSGERPISLPVNGELWLWPPGNPAWDLEGAYELKKHDGSEIDGRVVSIPSVGEKEFRIHLAKTAPIHQDTAALKRIFRSGDWHIQFIFTTDRKRRILRYSPLIPFTAKGMSPVYAFDIH